MIDGGSTTGQRSRRLASTPDKYPRRIVTTKAGNSVGVFVKPVKHAFHKEGGTPFLTSTRPNLFPETLDQTAGT